jgi:hypothetical protein
MKYKAGDRVRIRSKEWMDAQKKNANGEITKNGLCLSERMFMYAGRTATIKRICPNGTYKLDIDNERHWWMDWMFDPDYKADELLSAEDAFEYLINGETLYDKEGKPRRFTDDEINTFYSLYRLPAKRKRPMTSWEVLDWANSEASRGWVVLCIYNNGNRPKWSPPQFFDYDDNVARYRRARMLPDLSGVDESTIQGFEVEE